MSERISFTDVKLEGGWLMVKPLKEDLGKAMSIVRKRTGKLMDLEVKEHRKKRSLDANAYAWVLIGKIADALRLKPTEVYRQTILDIGGNYEIIPIKIEAADHFKQIWEAQGLGWPCVDMGRSKIQGYQNLKCYYGSSTYDTRQMAQFIDILVQDCLALDLEVKSEEEIRSLLGSWQ